MNFIFPDNKQKDLRDSDHCEKTGWNENAMPASAIAFRGAAGVGSI